MRIFAFIGILFAFSAFAVPSRAMAVYECDSSVRCFRDDLADGDTKTCDQLGGYCQNRQCWCGGTAPSICSDTERCDSRGYEFGQDPPGEESIDITDCRGALSGAKGGVLSYCFPKNPVIIPPPTGSIQNITSPRSTALTSDPVVWGTGSRKVSPAPEILGKITGTVTGGTGAGYVVETVIRRGDGTVCNDWTGAAWSGDCSIQTASVFGGTLWQLTGTSVPPLEQMTSGQMYRVYARFTDSSGKTSDWIFTPLILFELPVIPPVATDVKVSIRDYCSNPTGGDVSWTYTGTGNQSAYQIQVADSRGFGTPAYDSGRIENSGTAVYVSGTGSAGFAPGITWGTTYQARVTVWDVNAVPALGYTVQSQCLGTGCVGASSWLTPNTAYPRPSFTYTPARPPAGQATQFIGSASCLGGGCSQWNWTFEGAQVVMGKDQSHSFSAQGIYPVSLQVTDFNGNSCSVIQQVTVDKAIPSWKEVIPGR